MRGRQYKYLDLLKLIAVTFVCMYHFWRGTQQELLGVAGFLQTYFYSVLSTCVPLFFAVNGALLLNREGLDAGRHFRKLAAIFLQYWIWHGISVVVLGHWEGLDFSAMHKHQLLNVFFLLETPAGVDLNHFWFIPTLCGVYVLYPFLAAVFQQEHRDRNARTAVTCLLLVTYFLCFFLQDADIFKNISPYLMYLNLEQFRSFDVFGMRIGTMLPYFLLGGFLHRYREKTGKIPTAVCILMVLAGLLLSYAIVTIKAWQGETGYDIVFEGYGSTGTLLCTVGIFLLASRLEEKMPAQGVFRKVTQKVSRNTMTVYYTHWILGYTLLTVLPVGYGCFWNLLKTAMFVVCGTLLGEVLRRIPVLKHLIH